MFTKKSKVVISTTNEFENRGKIQAKTNDGMQKYFKEHTMTNHNGTWSDGTLNEKNDRNAYNDIHKEAIKDVKHEREIENIKYETKVKSIYLTPEELMKKKKENKKHMKQSFVAFLAIDKLHDDIVEINKEYEKEVDSHVCRGKQGCWWDGTSDEILEKAKKAITSIVRSKNNKKYQVSIEG